MAIDSADLDVNNGLETAETRSVVGTDNETKSDVIELTEDEKRIEIMNTLINNQKYHNMLEVCTRLKFDLNGLIIMNMDPTELTHLNRNNVQSVVDDALEATRKFITESTVGLVLRTDGTVNVAESIAEAVDSGGVIANGFIDPELNVKVRSMYEERFENLHRDDSLERRLFDMLEEERPTILEGFIDRPFPKIPRKLLEEVINKYNLYGHEAAMSELTKGFLDQNKDEVIKKFNQYLATIAQSFIDRRNLELEGETDPKKISSSRYSCDASIRKLASAYKIPEADVEKLFNGTAGMDITPEDKHSFQLELVREYYTIAKDLEDKGRPLSYHTRVEGALFAYYSTRGLSEYEALNQSAIDEIYNRCPHLIKKGRNGRTIDEKALKQFFQLCYPNIDFSQNMHDVIMQTIQTNITSSLSSSATIKLWEALEMDTDENTYENERRNDSSGKVALRLTSLESNRSDKAMYRRNDVYRDLVLIKRVLNQRDMYIQQIQEKYPKLKINKSFITDVVNGVNNDYDFSAEDIEIMNRAILDEGFVDRINIVRNEWLADPDFLAAFSNIIYVDPKTGHNEIDFDKAQAEFDRRKSCINLGGQTISQEQLRVELLQRVTAYKNGIKRENPDPSDVLSRFSDEFLLKKIEKDMPDFYGEITTNNSTYTLDSLSLKDLQATTAYSQDRYEAKKKYAYTFEVDNKAYNAYGIAKLFDDSFVKIKNNRKWKALGLRLDSPREKLLEAFPEYKKELETMFKTRDIMGDVNNIMLFGEYYEGTQNELNVGRLHRILKEKIDTKTIIEDDYTPQSIYEVKGRKYTKTALVEEYFDLLDLKEFNPLDYEQNHLEKQKMIEDIIKTDPAFKQYLNSNGLINEFNLRVYREVIKAKLGPEQYGIVSRPDSIKVKIGDKEYNQVDIPSEVVKLSRRAGYKTKNKEIEQLLEYIEKNPEIYGKDVSESVASSKKGEYSYEVEQLGEKFESKYVVDRISMTREEIIRILAEKHFGNETDEGRQNGELLQFHHSGDIKDAPIRSIESSIIYKYGKDFRDILSTKKNKLVINWNKVMAEYEEISNSIEGDKESSISLYKVGDKNYTADGVMLRLIELAEEKKELENLGETNSKQYKDCQKLMIKVGCLISDPKNYKDFGEYIEYYTDSKKSGFAGVRKHVSEIRKDKEKLEKCKPIDESKLSEDFKIATRNGKETRLFNVGDLKKHRKPDLSDPKLSRTEKQFLLRDNALQKIQDISVYGTSDEISEKIYQEFSSQAFCRREKNKYDYIVSSLLDVCDELKKSNPDMASFLMPGIIKRIDLNITRFKSLDDGSNAQEVALAEELSVETYKRLYEYKTEKAMAHGELTEALKKKKEEDYKLIAKEASRRKETKKVAAQKRQNYRETKSHFMSNLAKEMAKRITSEKEIVNGPDYVKTVSEAVKSVKARNEKEEEMKKALDEKGLDALLHPNTVIGKEGEKKIQGMQEELTVDEEGHQKALAEMAKGKQEDLSKKPISDKESKDVLDKNGQNMNVAEPPQLDAEGKKIEGQESVNLGNKPNEQDISSKTDSKENQSNETFETAGATDSEGSDTTSSASDNVHQESENNNLPAKDSVFNRIKRGFINFINNITGKKEKETEDTSKSTEDKNDLAPKENQETVGDFNNSLKVEGATGKLQESDLNADNRTSEAKAKNAGNSTDKKADDQGPEQEM